MCELLLCKDKLGLPVASLLLVLVQLRGTYST